MKLLTAIAGFNTTKLVISRLETLVENPSRVINL